MVSHLRIIVVNRHSFDPAGVGRYAIGPDIGPKVSRGPVGGRPAGGIGRHGALAHLSLARIRAGESFSKNVLASAGEFPYSTSSHGGVAQLGERLTGSQEVRGSIPLVSTRALNEAPTQVGAFFHINKNAATNSRCILAVSPVSPRD